MSKVTNWGVHGEYEYIDFVFSDVKKYTTFVLCLNEFLWYYSARGKQGSKCVSTIKELR